MKQKLEYRGEPRELNILRDWSREKEAIYQKRYSPYFKEREIWWAAIGHNIGDEQNGKNRNFERPVLIIKKFNNNLLLGLPLTSKTRTGKYYYSISLHNGESSVILSQIRILDAKRLIRKMSYIDERDYSNILRFLFKIINGSR